MGDRWEDVDQLFVDTATRELQADGEAQPCLVAFTGEALRFIAFVRPFAKGEYADPLIELLALAMPLDADRLAFAITGRMWSLDDPIPPVTEDADLRQRGLICEFVDGWRRRARSHTLIHPFDLDGDRVAWHDPIRQQDAAGWIPHALVLAVRQRRKLANSTAEIRRQAERCVHLGHDLYLSPQVSDRLHLSGRSTGPQGQGRRQSTGSAPICSSMAFARLKGREPKKPE